MTQAGMRPPGTEGAGGRGRDRAVGRAPWAGGPARPYLEVLRLPGALGFASAGFIARMPMSMFGLGTVLLIAALTRRYGLAGWWPRLDRWDTRWGRRSSRSSPTATV